MEPQGCSLVQKAGHTATAYWRKKTRPGPLSKSHFRSEVGNRVFLMRLFTNTAPILDGTTFVIHLQLMRSLPIRFASIGFTSSPSELILQEEGPIGVILPWLFTGLIHFCHGDDELPSLQEQGVHLMESPLAAKHYSDRKAQLQTVQPKRCFSFFPPCRCLRCLRCLRLLAVLAVLAVVTSLRQATTVVPWERWPLGPASGCTNLSRASAVQ